MKLKQGRTMPLTSEQFEQLPDFVKSDYIEHEGAYVPQAELKVKGLKSSLDGLDAKFKGVESKLAEVEQNKAAEIEAARAKALEEARSKGDVKAIEERYQQQMTDLEKRTREEARNEALKEFKTESAKAKAAGLAEVIAVGVAVDQKAAKALKRLLLDRTRFDAETDKEYFLDDNGSALSVDRAGFEKLIAEEYPHLVKFTAATTGGGNANGNSGGGAPSGSQNTEAQEARKKGDLTGFIKANLKG